MLYGAKTSLLAPVLTLLLLGGVSLDWSLFHQPMEDLEPHHRLVRLAIEKMPLRVGNWMGSDNEVLDSAVELLRPNIILSRVYFNPRTGERVSFLIVHCKDTRDLRGHFPPVCYPAHGWTLLDGKPRDWTVGDTVVKGMEYEFHRAEFSRTNHITIYNFMIRPGAGVERQMPGLNRASEDRRLRAMGGGQFQLLFDQESSRADRDKVLSDLLAPFLSTMDLISSGARYEQ